MLTMNPALFVPRPSRSMPAQSQGASRYTPATDTVHFASSGHVDKEYLEHFFKDNPTDPNRAPNVLAPQSRTEKAVGIAFQIYKDDLKQGKRPFLPKSYRESLINEGLLKADNQSWDVERSAFRRYITEVLGKNESKETRNRLLQEVGFKLKSKHKKTDKPAAEEVQVEIPVPITSVTQKPKVWQSSFDWADEAASAPAFVEAAKKEAEQNQGFGYALLQLMAKKSNSKRR